VLLTGALFWFLLSITLETRINRSGISYRLKPFHSNYKLIEWMQIDSVEVRDYKPIREYGGWGYRNSFGKKGVAYSISGKVGIDIKLKNGKRILIGTLKGEEAREALKQFFS